MYQAAAGSLQLQCTGQKLLNIHQFRPLKEVVVDNHSQNQFKGEPMEDVSEDICSGNSHQFKGEPMEDVSEDICSGNSHQFKGEPMEDVSEDICSGNSHQFKGEPMEDVSEDICFQVILINSKGSQWKMYPKIYVFR